MDNKLLLESIGMGILVGLLIYMGIAILLAVLAFINYHGGMPYVVGFIFLIAVVIFSVIFYYQKR